MEQRLKNLIEYCQGIFRNENGKSLYEKYLEDIKTITPMDLIYIENEQLKMGMKPSDMLRFVDKLINVFYKYLKEFDWDRPEEGTFLSYLMKENEALVQKLNAFKQVVKTRGWEEERERIYEFLLEMQQYNDHMLKLENILFPMLEQKQDRFNGMQIMWALHDQVRGMLKNMLKRILEEPYEPEEIQIDLGMLYFRLFGMVQKQELILFPTATNVFTTEEFRWMHHQSREYGFPYIDRPERFEKPSTVTPFDHDPAKPFPTLTFGTGSLTIEQIKALLDVLPLDITLVDDQDRVVYYSNPIERIFPRSPAIIGRNVRNCHPPDSVHVVEDILDAFKKGKKDHASFWIQRQEQFILIQYVPLRDKEGSYLGTLEYSQEVSHIRGLTGERRLLQWLED